MIGMLPQPAGSSTRKMQLIFIIAFALLLALPERGLFEPFWPDLTATLIGVGCLALLVPTGAGLAGRFCLRRLHRPDGFARATSAFGRVQLGLRVAMLAGLALLLTETGWIRLVRDHWHLDRWPLLDELVLVSPLLTAALLAWLVLYPVDRALRIAAGAGLATAAGRVRGVWSWPQYMDFQIRYQMLAVLVPMSLIVLAYDLVAKTRGSLEDLTGVAWSGDALLLAAVGVVFLTAPAMLRRIWRTQRMEPSALRARLERLCRRLNLRYREILIWHSHGVMVNAAVMGLLPRLRYILLSDGLLENLTEDQIEAVFGHEAGHIKEHHIAYYLLFAVASMLAVGAGGYWLEAAHEMRPEDIELAAAGMIGLIWGIAFGWISRRFERQADLYGVRCLGQTIQQCHLPCWLHNMTPARPIDKPICATAAGLFASALEVVAAMNGISKHARSWRHSSMLSSLTWSCDSSGRSRGPSSPWSAR